MPVGGSGGEPVQNPPGGDTPTVVELGGPPTTVDVPTTDLPRTGADVGLVAVLGALVVLAGGGLLLVPATPRYVGRHVRS